MSKALFQKKRNLLMQNPMRIKKGQKGKKNLCEQIVK